MRAIYVSLETKNQCDLKINICYVSVTRNKCQGFPFISTVPSAALRMENEQTLMCNKYFLQSFATNYSCSIDQVHEMTAGLWQSPGNVTDSQIRLRSVLSFSSFNLADDKISSESLHFNISSNSWVGSPGSCVGVKGLLLLQHTDPLQ